MHKSKDIKTAIEEQNRTYITTYEPADLKLRPIVAAPACPTYRFSNLDILLKNIFEMDYLNKMTETTDPNTLLVTFE